MRFQRINNLQKWQQQALSVQANDEVLDHIQQLISQTRQHPELAHGLSPRAGLSFFKLSQALAFMAGRDFVIPEDVAAAFYPVCRHRLVSSQGFDVVKKIINQIMAETPFV